MGSRFSIILIVIALGFGGILLFSKKDTSQNNGGGGSSSSQVTNHVRGEGKKKVVLTEYGDFECPACGAYFPLVEEVFEKYKEDITFQFRNFPLAQLHPNAMQAHRAAEAASNQNKFWEMYQMLYQNQSSWSQGGDANATFRSYAQSLGLDLAKYDTDFKSAATNAIINADISEGKKLGITGTPAFFINGQKIENPKDGEAFKKLIQDAIDKAQ